EPTYKMKHKIILIFITLLCASCAGYRVTKFTAASVKLGNRKELLIKKFGQPFKISLQKDRDFIYYKEVVDISCYPFI
ncbi:hypothetical protein, partial [Bacteroides acidifaciens]|uniref:hypothetical protein n=1 Tax=Bacteroides acidifaciens TaxID=85831 RepID=UPI00272CB8B5